MTHGKKVQVTSNAESGNIFRKGSVVTPADFHANDAAARQLKQANGAVKKAVKDTTQGNKFIKSSNRDLLRKLDSSSDSNSSSSEEMVPFIVRTTK